MDFNAIYINFLYFHLSFSHMASLLQIITLVCVVTVIKTDNMPPQTYGRDELLLLRPAAVSRVPSDVYGTIRALNISSVKPTKRGQRSFVKHQHPIPTITNSNRKKPINVLPLHNVNFENLLPVRNHNSIPSKLNAGLWNAQSLRNKSDMFVDFVTENDLDLAIVTESWLTSNDRVVEGECTLPGYVFLNIPRPSDNPSGNRGGGIAILFKEQLNIQIRSNQLKTTYFENVTLTDTANNLNLVVIYRPPPSPTNGFRTTDFLNEFDEFLEDVALLPGKFLLAGDINIHWNEQSRSDVRQYASIITSANLIQHVSKPTHRDGNILDHILSCEDGDLFVDCEVHEKFITVHHYVLFTLNMSKPPRVRITKTFRNFESIDNAKFAECLQDRLYPLPETNDADILFEWYIEITQNVLDEIAPPETRARTQRNQQPWYDEDVHSVRRLRRRAERKWRHTQLETDREEFAAANRLVNQSIIKAKKCYYSDKLADANNKTVFKVVNSMLNNQDKSLPSFNDPQQLSNDFAHFFVNKICKIRDDLDSDPQRPTVSQFPESCPSDCEPLTEFHQVSEGYVSSVISKASNASCQLDSHPTWFLKKHLKDHLPAITAIVNSSLSSGNFPAAAHRAIVSPIIKKPSLDKEVLKHYRPVSNLNFVAKIVEKCAAAQLVEHLEINNLSCPLQSAYRSQHSTETALIKVCSDIVSDIDSRRVVLVALLDMSAAFDTVDHAILLDRLTQRYAISGTAHKWFASYVTDWSSQVSIQCALSEPMIASYGVPQGSVLGPLLFTCYSNPITDIVQKHCLNFHLYADDLQLYASFDPRIPGDLEHTLDRFTQCIAEIRSCLSANYLKLNDSKTEFFIAGADNKLKLLNLSNIELLIGNSKIKLSPVIRNLGCFMDSNLSLTSHVDNLRKSILFHIRNLWRIRPFINKDTCHHSVRALVTSRLDYCNALFTLLSVNNVQRLQRLQNSAARLVFGVGRRVEADPLIRSLHWLTVDKRIIFKILMYVYKVLNNLAPRYLSEQFKLYVPARPLRSANDTTRLIIPRTNLRIGDRRFNTTASASWNSLPASIRCAPSLDSFKSQLKTHLF